MISNDPECINTLIDSIVAKGAVVSNVDFKSQDESGYGIYAKSDITEKGTTLISVPFKLCITADLIANSPQLSTLFKENSGFLNYPDEVLAIGLMYAVTNPSDTECAWLEHVNTMPSHFNTTIYWSEDELQELKDTNAFHLTKLMKGQMKADFEGLHKPLAEAYPEILSNISFDLYAWALSIVYSRSLELTRNNEHVRCIVPVLDMANHNPFSAESPFDTFHYDDATDCVSLLSAGPLAKGDECFAIYGIYPNAKLIYNYGFVILNNPHRAIDVWTRVGPSSYQATWKNQQLQSHGLTRDQTYDFKGTIRPGWVSPALLATIRVIQVADEAEMEAVDRAFVGGMISVRNEMASYVALRNLLTARMKPEQAEV